MAHNHDHSHSLYDELICHFPYAVFSVAACLVVLSLLGYASFGNTDHHVMHESYGLLFHSFHFMHIVFAATGTMITYLRFSRNIFKAIVVSIFSPMFFCILSDAILPYFGGRMLGVPMHFHICFFSSEIVNVLPFLAAGIINGFAMSKHHSSNQSFYSISSHFVHILVSSLASSFYLVSHGFFNWYTQIGSVFLFLIGAVVVPCTLSDVVVPMAFARADKKDAKHTAGKR